MTPYPRVPDDEPNAHFTVTVNGTTVEACGTVMNVGYAHFAFTDIVKVEITASEPIQTFDLSPHRAGIKAAVAGKTQTFELSQPRWVHLQVNQLPRFFVFAEAPEAPLFPPPLPGRTPFETVIRWLTPPANFRCASGAFSKASV